MKDDTNVNRPQTIEEAVDLIKRSAATISHLHQTIDELTNTMAMQKELIQQLKDEIAVLKGQKPKPKIAPSKLEGPKRKDRGEGGNLGGKPGQPKGKNQYTTVIGNRWFSVFTTTDSKSRVNFLKLLQGGKNEYVINEDTVGYLRMIGAADYLSGYVALSFGEEFSTLEDWEIFLQKRNIIKKTAVRFVTEAGLYASVIRNGIPRDMEVHSDDAGQFDLFFHFLCWIHEERHYRKLIMTTDEAKADLERVRDQIWTIYRGLQAYKENPNELSIPIIEKLFDAIFQQKTSSPTLNHQLQKTYVKKENLLKALQRPTVLLHNNGSESDARSSKIKLKISGGTRSDAGKNARDTFLSLKQTCLKLGINFIAFLKDRVRRLYVIPRLAEIIRQRSGTGQAPPEYNDGSLQISVAA